MKKNSLIIAIFIIVLVILFIYLQWGREVKICNSTVDISGDCRSENISLIANKLFIVDKEKFASDIIHNCITDAAFSDIKFSFDLGYPNEMAITVYINEADKQDGKVNFTIIYSQDKKYKYQYDIKNNPEKFNIEICY